MSLGKYSLSLEHWSPSREVLVVVQSAFAANCSNYII